MQAIDQLFSKDKTVAKPGKSGKTTIDSLIGSKMSITGDLLFSGGLRIDGKIRGNIIASEDDAHSLIVISEHGAVEGEVRAAHIIISGSIIGPLIATEMLELQPSARVHGDVQYKILEMHSGAVVEGKLHHDGELKPSLKLASNNA